MNKALLLIALAAAIGIGGGLALSIYGRDGDFSQCRETVVAGGAGEIGGPFTLVSETGETLTEADVLDGPALVYFGYTFCPDVCPFDAVRNADAVELLADSGHDVRSVMITVDPDRDTPEVMEDYTANIHPDMLGLTGSPEQIAAAASAYRVYYRAHKGDDPYYLVDHSSFTYLMLPDHGFVEFFRRELPAEELASKVACFLEAS